MNRILALIFFVFVWGALGEVGIRISTSVQQARFWLNFSGLCWLFIGSLFLHFALTYSEKKEILGRKLIYFLLYIPPSVFLYLLWETNFIFQEMGRFHWGYYDIPGRGFILVMAYLQIFFFFGLYFCWQVYRKSFSIRRKKQAKYIFIASLLAIIGGNITEGILPIIGIPIIRVGAIFASLPLGVLIYVMEKYKFMSITPQLAAESIITSMRDSLIVVNPDGTIATVNKAAERLSGYREEEVIGKPVAALFEEDERKLENLFKDETVENLRIKYLNRNKKAIPVTLSSSEVRDKYGDLVGKVVVAKDMREIERLIDELEEARENLEEKIKEKTRELEESKNELLLRLEELERWRKVTVGREEKMIQLKKEIEKLREKLREIV